MAYRLIMDKSLSIKTLRDSGLSERAIAESLGVSRNAVRRHLASNPQSDTKAPTEDHGFDGKYWSVRRFVKSLGASSELPFRRIEVDPGWELQVSRFMD